ncbi:N-acetylmuramoyl-L-alanine amidase [Oceanobacillus caeni]|uniref:N-acetylmuramoyl-L-alanine amidase n=1 Tax=Oceanobacillus caeni TaxID=405946 RepID=UPI002149DDAD|nr:N-acetylmuramoyl-L-alanine amidase [Oceanobacillus caeni]MCR1835785.1 N-acetylmuramoyl-L-alanine amidase [Oceanobacillus caeni]
MKKNILIGIGFLVCLFIFIPTVHADSGQLYKVNSEIVELRNAPDQNGTVLAELKNGTEVTIFQESYGWGSTFYNGEQAWVALHQLEAVNETQVEEKDVEQPEAKESQNQTAAPLEKDTASSDSVESGKLYEVKVPALRLRTSPDKNSTIIIELNMGTEVTIFQESSGWGRTFYNGKEAWMALEFLDEKNKSTEFTMSEVSEEADLQQTTEVTEREELEGELVPPYEDEELDEERDEKEESVVETREQEENQEAQRKQSDGKTLSGYHFVIDPGHGGKDTGAVRTEVYEKTLTLYTAKKVEEQLHNKGASVTLTRSDDTFIPLEERVQISNSTNTDVFVSLHYNAFEDQSVRGIHTFYYGGGENQKLADTVHKALINDVKLHDRGTKHADFKVLKDNNQLAILLELGFISNSEELKLVQTGKYQEKAAKGIVAGLEDYFN